MGMFALAVFRTGSVKTRLSVESGNCPRYSISNSRLGGLSSVGGCWAAELLDRSSSAISALISTSRAGRIAFSISRRSCASSAPLLISGHRLQIADRLSASALAWWVLIVACGMADTSFSRIGRTVLRSWSSWESSSAAGAVSVGWCVIRRSIAILASPVSLASDRSSHFTAALARSLMSVAPPGGSRRCPRPSTAGRTRRPSGSGLRRTTGGAARCTGRRGWRIGPSGPGSRGPRRGSPCL